MFHMFGYETSASQAALTAITPIPDPTLAISGNDVRVPNGMANLLAAAALINSNVATLRCEVVSPSLRAMLNLDVSPINNGLVFMTTSTAQLPRYLRMWQNPLPLAALEPLDVQIQNGAAVMNRAFIIIGDGPVKPVSGAMYSIRGTLAASLVTASWVNSQVTFNQVLPAGTYQCVGFRVFSANLVAARIFFNGAMWRPGAFAATAEDVGDWPEFRYGGLGVWGQFDNTVPPTIDCMGITDTAQTFIMDLIKIK